MTEVKASHMMGGSITYTHVAGNQYRVRVVMYRDCIGITPSTSVSLTITNSCGLANPVVSLPQIAGSPFDQTPLCPSQTSNCSGGANNGFTAYIYEGLVNLPGVCSDWTFSYVESSRNDAITNHNALDGYYNYTILNNATSTNNAALWTNTIPSFICLNQTFTFNAGAHDVDGDSLYFDLVNPQQSAGTPITWNAGFSATNPYTASTFTLNNFTGEVTIVPTAIQIGNFAVRVREYRNGVLVGTSVRDIQFVVRNCGTNDINTATGIRIGGVPTPTPFVVNCAQGLLTFTLNATDADAADILSMTWDNAFAGPTFTTAGTGGAGGITGTFSWNIPPGTAGIRILTFTVKDNFCPYPGVRVYTVKLEFAPVNAGPDVGFCGGAGVQLSAVGGDSWTWAPALGLSCTNCQSPIASPLVTTTYTVTNNCGNTDQVTVSVPGIFTLSGTAPTTICAGQSTPISVTPNPAAGAYTYSWSPTTGLSNPAIANPTATPAGTTTYVCTVTKGGCSQTFSVPITVIVSPIINIVSNPDTNLCVGEVTTLTADAYVPPSTCGINATACTGTTTSTTIGTGSTTETYPFHGFYHDSRSQMIFTKTELNAAGIFGGRIDQLAFNVTSKASTQAYTGFTVKMGCTALGTFPTTTFQTGLATVYSGNYTTTAGTNNITFTTGYDWDGNTNLIVEFCFDNTSYTSNDVVSATNLGVSQMIYNYADASIGCTMNGSYSSNTRPNVSFRVCTSNAGLTYLWSPNTDLTSTTTAVTDADPITTTTYNVRVTHTASGCFRDKTVTVNVGAVFNIETSAPVNMCLGGNATISAGPIDANGDPLLTGGPYVYTWTPATGLSNPNIANPIASPTVTTPYQCTVRNAAGCEQVGTVTVTVTGTGAPVVTASANKNLVCPTANLVNFTSSAAATGCVYTQSSITYSMPDMTSGTTNHALANDAQTTVALPFTFNYYCANYNNVSICSNGFIQFGGTSTSFTPQTIPDVTAPNGVVAFCWVDLKASTVQTKTFGTAPNRSYVVYWDVRTVNAIGNERCHGGIILYETTNVIEIFTERVRSTANKTQGIENAAGTDGIGIAGRNNSGWRTNLKHERFTPVSTTYTITWTDPNGLVIGNTANINNYPVTVSGNYTATYDNGSCAGNGIVPVTIMAALAGPDSTICPSKSITLAGGQSFTPSPGTCSAVAPTGFTYNNFTVGAGVTTSSTVTPYRGLYEDGRIQMIYTPADLTAAGIAQGGYINSLAFNVTATTAQTYTGFTISMGCASQTTYSSATFLTGLSTVYTGNIAAPTVGWNTYNFTNHYAWDGVSNLVVEVCFNNAAWTSSATIQYTATAGNTVCYAEADGVIGCTLAGETMSTNRPNIRLGYATMPVTYSWSPATGLSATNIANPVATPASSQTYTLSVTANGCTVTDQVTITVAPPAALVWTGNVSTDWFDSGNWDLNCVPACATTVTIPNVAPRPFPVVTGAAAFSGDITINAGASLTLNNNDFNACGHFINNGIFNPGTRRLIFIGTNPQNYQSNNILYNVTVNNTAAGNNAYINLLSNLEVDNAATLTFTSGRIITNAFKVYINNNASAAIIGHANMRYVQGNLYRAVTGTRSYDFPVGLTPTGLGYQLANVNFTVAPTFNSLNAYFIDYASTATPSVSLTDGAPCASVYNCIRTNHGKWIIDPSTVGTSTYNITVYPLGGTSTCSGTTWTVMKQPTGGAGAWALQGTNCTNGTASAPLRNGLTSFSEFAAVAFTTVLPVEILEFNAVLENENDGKITWTTTNEVNNYGYYLQKSTDNQIFTDVTFVTPNQADPNNLHNYAYLDENLSAGVYYYKLRQVDLNGTTNFSNVEILQVGNAGFALYPNPSQEFTNVIFSNPDNLPFQIDVYDAQGKLVRKTSENSGSSYRLEKADLSSGVYFIQLTLGTQKWRQKFVLIP